jgi:hypothetical protein
MSALLPYLSGRYLVNMISAVRGMRGIGLSFALYFGAPFFQALSFLRLLVISFQTRLSERLPSFRLRPPK